MTIAGMCVELNLSQYFHTTISRISSSENKLLFIMLSASIKRSIECLKCVSETPKSCLIMKPCYTVGL